MSSRGGWLMLGVTWVAAGSGCFAPEIAIGLPCAHDDPDHATCPSGQVCDTAADMCVPESALGTWRDDAAADFADPTAVLADATIEPAGAIGPAPYFVDGVATFGIHARAIGAGNEATVSWDAIAAQPTTGRGFYRELDLDYPGGVPMPGTGLPDTSEVTVRIEGEIYLYAGTSEVEVFADDRGFFDLADPATGAYSRVTSDASGGPPSTGSVTVPGDGWYPFHAAVEASGGAVHYRLQVADPAGNLDDIPPDRLRVRVDGLAGLAVDGFDDADLFIPFGTTLATVSPGDRQDYGTTGYPADTGPLGNAAWTARWSGQVLVDTAGAYTFHLDSRGGHRMWLDGVQLADTADPANAEETVTPAVDLDAGWHDLVIDSMKDTPGQSSPSYFQINVASGPALAGAFFPIDHQRPVVGRGARWTYDGSQAGLAIPDVGAATRTVYVDLPQDATARLADYAYTVTHPVQSSVGVDLARPGATTTLVAVGALTGAGSFGDRLHFTGLDADGGWDLTATDTVLDVMTGSITSVKLAVTYAGGRAPLATHAVYTSRIRELGPDVVAISGVRWQPRQERDGGVVAVFVRSCDTAAACATEPWQEVARSGDAAGIAPRPFVQYQVDLTTGGEVATGLDWIEIDYRLP